jgi:hypothetical protein
MTRQQLKNSGKMLKKNCMGKNQVTEGKLLQHIGLYLLIDDRFGAVVQ